MADSVDDFLTGASGTTTAPAAVAAQPDSIDTFLTGGDAEPRRLGQRKAEPAPSMGYGEMAVNALGSVYRGMSLGDPLQQAYNWAFPNTEIAKATSPGGFIHDRAKQYATEHPFLNAAGEVIGSIPTVALADVGLAAKGVTSANLLGQATRGAVIGGAAAGSMSEGTPAERVTAAAEGAAAGAALVPLGNAVVGTGKLAGRGATGAFNYLTGRGPAIEVEEAMAAARARAGAAPAAAPPPAAPPPAAAPPAAAPAAAPAPAAGSPGIAQAMQGMGGGIGDSLRNMLWEKLQRGDTTELGKPSRILIAAKEAMDRGEIKTRADFDNFTGKPVTPPASTGAVSATGVPVTPGGPQSVGAAASRDMSNPAEIAANAPTRRQEIAGKVDYIDQMLGDRPNIGRPDFNEYVAGNTPTQAEGLGDAHLASVQRQVEPGNQQFTNKRSQDVDNRVDHFEDRAGTATMLENKEDALSAWDEKTLGPVWAKKSPVDASGVLRDVDARLSSPAAQIGPVEQALSEVKSRLFKRGTDVLHDDPEMLYGARRQISFMLSRAGRQANPAYGDADVMRQLIGVRDQIDQAIEPGAPGFKGWLTGHAAEAQDIDRMDVLQSMRKKIVGANGDIQLSRLTTAIKGLRDKMAADGANPVHALNLDDLEMLRDLRRDLLREGNKALSMPVGSPTAHNLDVGAQMGVNAATAGAHVLASHIPGANYLLDQGLGKRALANTAKSKELWVRNLLQPPP